MLTVNFVSVESIPQIQSLAKKTWAVAYSEIISPAQMTYMLDLFYSDASLQQQMKEGHQFIAAIENSIILGFASYAQKEVVNSLDNIYRLHKIYIDPNQQGKGIGKLLIQFIINDIQPKLATDLELNVNRNNKALHFYKKLGFEIIKEEDIDIGHNYFMNDYVLNLPL